MSITEGGYDISSIFVKSIRLLRPNIHTAYRVGLRKRQKAHWIFKHFDAILRKR